MGFPKSMAIVMSGSALVGGVLFSTGASPRAGAAVGVAEAAVPDDGCCGPHGGRSSTRDVNRNQHRERLATDIRNGNSNIGYGHAQQQGHGAQSSGATSSAASAPEPPPAAPPGAPTAAMRSYLRDLAENTGFTGSVLVVRRGRVLARFAAGEADEERHIPLRPNTVFRLASVTKQFTAMLVLKLRDRGLLGLDDPICPYLVPVFINACPEAWRPITVRETVIHTSGIPDIQGLPGFYDELSQPTTTRRLIQRFVNLPLDFPPGTSWKYTNSGFILAGAIIERVTHQPYGAVLRDEITGPLHLRHTGYSRGNPPPGYAKGYFTVGSPAPPINGSQAFAATGIYSTTDDIARWDRSFGAHLVAPPATVEEALTPQAPCPPGGCLTLPSSAYAFGWLIDRLDGHRLVYHPGLLQGYAASNMYLPDDDIEVVVLSNVEDTDTNGIARHLATLALES
ncbi:serine hydrolase domain-containing protein [Actinoallomurus soli]|uniref:serine hydrolase domain-containing protein n=1 Tax=Actinoallomurus soli TaxID=2952535 RepID=UPI002092160F|nr:serine hydrolase domain-containing protein [Actinoallomurus soli]MCO5973800.1 beta-lactamase family protein [Actinoallomurus soli]